MKEIEDIFDALEPDFESFRNLGMLIMTILVNKGILELHWDLHSQQFCFTAVEFCTDPSHQEEEENLLDMDPDEILRRMGLRNKKKNDG